MQTAFGVYVPLETETEVLENSRRDLPVGADIAVSLLKS
jgi:hypothetical protein